MINLIEQINRLFDNFQDPACGDRVFADSRGIEVSGGLPF